MKFVMKVRTWDSLLQAKFYKNRLCSIPLLGKFIPKITIFGDVGTVSPHLKVTIIKFGTRLRAWESLPHTKFCNIPL